MEPPMKRTIALHLTEPGVGNCEHTHLTWGFYPSVVTCSCGARFSAWIVKPEAGLHNLEKWDWFIFSLFVILLVVAIHTTWLLGTWVIFALAQTGDYIKRRRRRSW